jgi:hypothetical protein
MAEEVTLKVRIAKIREEADGIKSFTLTNLNGARLVGSKNSNGRECGPLCGSGIAVPEGVQ